MIEHKLSTPERRRSKVRWLLASIAVGLTMVTGCNPKETGNKAPLSIDEFLETDDQNEFNKALRPIAFQFPRVSP